MTRIFAVELEWNEHRGPSRGKWCPLSTRNVVADDARSALTLVEREAQRDYKTVAKVRAAAVRLLATA